MRTTEKSWPIANINIQFENPVRVSSTSNIEECSQFIGSAIGGAYGYFGEHIIVATINPGSCINGIRVMSTPGIRSVTRKQYVRMVTAHVFSTNASSIIIGRFSDEANPTATSFDLQLAKSISKQLRIFDVDVRFLMIIGKEQQHSYMLG